MFFNFINEQHPSIHFTMERETGHILPFLGIVINNTDPHFIDTTIYREKNSQTCSPVIKK